MLPALPVQHGSRRGAVFSALIINQGGRDFMSSLHATFWFIPVILFKHTDLSASESGFSSEDIYKEARVIPSLQVHQRRYAKLMIAGRDQHTFVGATPR